MNELDLVFKKEQVIKFKKGLEESSWAKWVRIANKVLKEKIAEGIAFLEAEILAIRAANSSFSTQEITGLSFSDMQEHEELRLAEVSSGSDDDFQLVIPVGVTYDDWYGEIILTKAFMEAMVKNQTVLQKTKPFLNEKHDRGKALGWAKEIRATEEGLEVKWDFTRLGRQYVEDDIYKYYSGEINSMLDRDTGEKVYPVFGGAALTNSPVMKDMPGAHLSEDKPNTADGPNIEGEESMDFSKLKEEALTLSDSDKSELVLALGFVKRDDEIVALTDKVSAMTEVNSTLKEQVISLGDKLKEIDEAKTEVFLSKAIADGKLKPADEAVWKERLNKDFGDYSKIIEELPVIIDLDGPRGTGQDEQTEGTDFKEKANEFLGKKAPKEEEK